MTATSSTPAPAAASSVRAANPMAPERWARLLARHAGQHLGWHNGAQRARLLLSAVFTPSTRKACTCASGNGFRSTAVEKDCLLYRQPARPSRVLLAAFIFSAPLLPAVWGGCNSICHGSRFDRPWAPVGPAVPFVAVPPPLLRPLDYPSRSSPHTWGMRPRRQLCGTTLTPASSLLRQPEISSAATSPTRLARQLAPTVEQINGFRVVIRRLHQTLFDQSPSTENADDSNPR